MLFCTFGKTKFMGLLTGTGVAIVTPFDQQKKIDFSALKKLIDFQIDGGIDYLVSLGTTGETPVLGFEEKCEVITRTVEYVNDRIPIIVGAGGNDTYKVINEMKILPLNGIKAILSASPYYNKPSQEGIYQHYKAIAEEAPLPLILYNVPGRTSRNVNADTALRLAHDFKNIIGIKEAANNMVQCVELLRQRPEGFAVVSGDDDLVLGQMALGMDGVISVAANAFPVEFSAMIRHCLNNEFDKARVINFKLASAYTLMFEENNPAGIKAFLSAMGYIENQLRLPLVPVQPELEKRIKGYLLKG
jgi:4-hydroxy-tetrahydrodipicolinate synthase